MKKMILSLLTLAVIGGGVFYSTNAFFSDSETSKDNTFAAGAIDLKIGNDSYLNGVLNPDTSWQLKNLEVEKYFNFADIKPGDWGEDTIKLKVEDNDAWVCAAITLTSNDENERTNPELDDQDPTADSSGDLFDGELANELHFIWWADDGDNVLEAGEKYATPFYNKLSNLMTWNDGDPNDKVLHLTIADSTWNFFEAAAVSQPLVGKQDYHIAKAWCFGDMTLNPVADPLVDHNPTVVSGVSCNGANVDNQSQTDKVTADIEFTAVQTENNMDYKCPENEL